MPLGPLIRHALLWGGVLSAVMAVLLLAILWWNPEILLNDYPPDIRAKHGPMSDRSKRQRIFVAVLMGVVGLGIVVASFADVGRGNDGAIPFLTAFVHLSVMFSVFNVVDLVVIDWPLVAIAPRFIVLPGTEGAAGYKNYEFHFRGFLIGIVVVLLASAVLAGILVTIG